MSEKTSSDSKGSESQRETPEMAIRIKTVRDIILKAIVRKSLRNQRGTKAPENS